jgi:hypothetical protein
MNTVHVSGGSQGGDISLDIVTKERDTVFKVIDAKF